MLNYSVAELRELFNFEFKTQNCHRQQFKIQNSKLKIAKGNNSKFKTQNSKLKMITIIAAIAANRAIGLNNKLLYWLPNDLKRFKALTTGHTIIMGRRTYESLPKGALPNRRNVVLTRTLTDLPGCDIYTSLDEALAHCSKDEDIYIIGGASVYVQALECADRLCLTEVHDTPADADAFFPEFKGWKETMREEHTTDEKHHQSYAFVDYVRK